MRELPLLKNWNKDSRNLTFILLTNLFVRFIYFWASVPYKTFGDTAGYVDFPFRKFIALQFESGRTPVYPAIIQLIDWVTTGEGLYYGIVAVQMLASLISIVFFYKALKFIIHYDGLIVLATIFYSCSSAVIGWDNAILTESFALSGCVIFIYLLFSYLHESSKKLAIGIPIYTLILTFLRPTFLYFSVIILIFFIVRYFQKTNRRHDRAGIGVSLLMLGIIGIYSYIFSLSHDVFSISNAKVRQDLIVSITQGYYKDSSNEAFVVLIDEKMEEFENDVWRVIHPVLGAYGNDGVARLVSEARNENLPEYVAYLKKLAIDSYNTYYDGYNIYNYDNQLALELNKIVSLPFLQLKFYHVYWIAIVEFVWIMGIIFKEKRIDLLHSGFFVFTAGIIVSTFIGTCGEYMRTSLMVVPFSYIALTYYASLAIARLNRTKL